VLWNKQGTEVVTSHGYSDHQLSLWKYPSLRRIADLTGHGARVLHLSMSPDGEVVVSAAADETIRFWRCFANSGGSTNESRREAATVGGGAAESSSDKKDDEENNPANSAKKSNSATKKNDTATTGGGRRSYNAGPVGAEAVDYDNDWDLNIR
jgi:WD40 repeat protein